MRIPLQRQATRWALLVLILAASLLSADRAKTHQAGKFREIPRESIKIPLRDVQQQDEYSCGACCLMAVCSYYGVGPRDLDSFKHNLKTDKTGTYYGNIVKYAQKLGLKAKVEKEMTPDQLKKLLDAGTPVICSIQAWAGPGKDYKENGDGHYVVAIGYDTEGHFYFMDPYTNQTGKAAANPRYGYLSQEDLIKRWHENEGTDTCPEPYKGLGIVIHPDPAKAKPWLRARRIE